MIRRRQPSPWRTLLALALAASLVDMVAWYGDAALISCGIVFLLLVVSVSLAIAVSLLCDWISRATAAAARRRLPVVNDDEVELEQARAWARSETELLPAGMTDRLWAEIAAELERRRRDAS